MKKNIVCDFCHNSFMAEKPEVFGGVNDEVSFVEFDEEIPHFCQNCGKSFIPENIRERINNSQGAVTTNAKAERIAESVQNQIDDWWDGI